MAKKSFAEMMQKLLGKKQTPKSLPKMSDVKEVEELIYTPGPSPEAKSQPTDKKTYSAEADKNKLDPRTPGYSLEKYSLPVFSGKKGMTAKEKEKLEEEKKKAQELLKKQLNLKPKLV